MGFPYFQFSYEFYLRSWMILWLCVVLAFGHFRKVIAEKSLNISTLSHWNLGSFSWIGKVRDLFCYFPSCWVTWISKRLISPHHSLLGPSLSGVCHLFRVPSRDLVSVRKVWFFIKNGARVIHSLFGFMLIHV